ncbi:MAG: glutaminyl-peptide cyclotransferase [Armatimonadota bacterium]
MPESDRVPEPAQRVPARDLRSPRAARGVLAVLLHAVFAAALLPACGGGVAEPSYTVVRRIPHDRTAFTQGLVVDGDHFWESTGLVGSSSLRRLDRVTGGETLRIAVPSPHFAEGIALHSGQLHQLTWQSGIGFVYDAKDLKRTGEFPIAGEGWGLAAYAGQLVLSDGSARLRFLSPTDHKVVRTLDVRDRGLPVARLNELEVVRGEIWANVWKLDRIARIDPSTGNVLGWVDLSGLLPAGERRADTDVLNGIAYDAADDRLYVTGKRWPWIYEIKTPESTGRRR